MQLGVLGPTCNGESQQEVRQGRRSKADEKAEKADPIRILKKIRKEKEGIFGKKKHYVRRKHVTQMRDK